MASTDSVILITGAASGIGLATATRLAADGAARLVLVDRDAAALARVDLPCSIDLLPGDVADEAFWETTTPYLGGLTGAVVNAGIIEVGQVADIALASWRRVLGTNLDGAFLTLRTAIRAIEGPGAIVVTASASVFTAQTGTAAYAASKAALIQLARVAASENAARGLRINAIAPGGVQTRLWDNIPSFADRAAAIGHTAAFAERAAGATPMARFATPEEVARQIAFLLSEEMALMTGAVLTIDGSYSL
ncbi:SDR family NAD(P)-dependent oxidoreductase [Sphingomonas sp. 1P08PE]|uniref:SDR family NAD(P)-dependent oxidoreductase n=1 Tax=Sphingomonas sp. 1P08PE TaxID=554122 RepID=UPI0039A3A0BF